MENYALVNGKNLQFLAEIFIWINSEKDKLLLTVPAIDTTLRAPKASRHDPLILHLKREARGKLEVYC